MRACRSWPDWPGGSELLRPQSGELNLKSRLCMHGVTSEQPSPARPASPVVARSSRAWRPPAAVSAPRSPSKSRSATPVSAAASISCCERTGRQCVELIDFKTSENRPPSEIHINQLRLYAAASERLGLEPVKLAIHDRSGRRPPACLWKRPPRARCLRGTT